MNVVDFPDRPEWVVELGPNRLGQTVIVDGRAIPRLVAIDKGEIMSFLLDGRFIYDVPRGQSGLFASAVAQALAIGAGYPHLGAESKSMPFAPKMMQIDTREPEE